MTAPPPGRAMALAAALAVAVALLVLTVPARSQPDDGLPEELQELRRLQELEELQELLERSAGEGPPLTLARYRDELRRLDRAIGEGRLGEARRRADRLRGRSVVWAPRGGPGGGPPGGDTFRTDDSVLRALAEARELGTARRHRPALRGLIASLEGEASQGPASPGQAALGQVPASPERQLLARLDEDRRARELRAGGELLTLDGETLEAPGFGAAVGDLLEPIRQALLDAFEWVRERYRELRDRLQRSPAEGAGGLVGGIDPTLLAVLLAVASALVLAVLAVRLARRRRARAPEGEAAGPPATPEQRDADPLSRNVSGWELRAAELAGEGRLREAVRAWYHAVLVGLLQGGWFREHRLRGAGGPRGHRLRGLTNWELVAAVATPASAASSWQAGLAELTRIFERSWYGASEPSPEVFAACQEVAGRLLAALDTARDAARRSASSEEAP